jgi:hypothetical protein
MMLNIQPCPTWSYVIPDVGWSCGNCMACMVSVTLRAVFLGSHLHTCACKHVLCHMLSFCCMHASLEMGRLQWALQDSRCRGAACAALLYKYARSFATSLECCARICLHFTRGHGYPAACHCQRSALALAYASQRLEVPQGSPGQWFSNLADQKQYFNNVVHTAYGCCQCIVLSPQMAWLQRVHVSLPGLAES